MRRILAAAALSLMTLPAVAQSLEIPSGTYSNDRTHTSVIFKINHFGLSTYSAMFARAGIDATVELDAQNVANSTLTVDMSKAGIVTAHPIEFDPRGIDFNEEIASSTFLNSAVSPITFKSTAIEPTGEFTATIAGELTLNGQTRPVTLDAKLNRALIHPMLGVPVFGISAEGTIDRAAFGIDALAGPVGTSVAIEIQAEFYQDQ